MRGLGGSDSAMTARYLPKHCTQLSRSGTSRRHFCGCSLDVAAGSSNEPRRRAFRLSRRSSAMSTNSPRRILATNLAGTGAKPSLRTNGWATVSSPDGLLPEVPVPPRLTASPPLSAPACSAAGEEVDPMGGPPATGSPRPSTTAGCGMVPRSLPGGTNRRRHHQHWKQNTPRHGPPLTHNVPRPTPRGSRPEPSPCGDAILGRIRQLAWPAAGLPLLTLLCDGSAPTMHVTSSHIN